MGKGDRHGHLFYLSLTISRDSVPAGSVERLVSDGPDDLILVYLRRIDEKIDHLATGQADVARRVTSLESKVALLHGDFAAQ